MSEKKRQKKDHQDVNKKRQQMREAKRAGTLEENDPNKRQGAAESDIKRE